MRNVCRTLLSPRAISIKRNRVLCKEFYGIGKKDKSKNSKIRIAANENGIMSAYAPALRILDA